MALVHIEQLRLRQPAYRIHFTRICYIEYYPFLRARESASHTLPYQCCGI